MSDFDSLREDLAGLGKALDGYSATAVRNLLEQSRQIDKLWADNAELRDELHAVANRLENLTRAVTTDPAEVAQAIVNDANRSVLRTVTNPEGRERISPALCTSPTCAFRADEHYHEVAGSVVFV